MLSYKKPEGEVRLLYPKMVELGLVVSLLIVIVIFLVSKKMDNDVTLQTADDVVLETEDIPITKQVKRPPPPARPTIPIEDPEVDLETDIDFENIDDIDWTMEAPPPPPSVEDEIVDFFLVEEKPAMIGGSRALYDYLQRKNLYPEMAQRANIEGVAIVKFVVDVNGNPTDVQVFQERPEGLGFGEAAVKAISAMKFSPGMQRDKAVPVRMQQKITFQLGG
ncbi:gram-negative bacterial tonB protein [bacterium BMS3Bbin04]|nr:gram-negative bacterial tonB protein [bacterium BMS3Bbin04]